MKKSLIKGNKWYNARYALETFYTDSDYCFTDNNLHTTNFLF